MILIVKSLSGLSRSIAFFTLAGCLSVLAGCGQQGPLYLPDTKIGPHGKPEVKSTGKVPQLPPPKIVDPNAPLPVAPNVNN